MLAFEVIGMLLCGLVGAGLILWWALDRPARTALSVAPAAEPMTPSGPGLCPETVSPTVRTGGAA